LSIASRVGLLADAGHEEDVVVDSERDQEDERDQRVARVLPGKVCEGFEEEQASSDRREEGEQDGAHQHQRRHERAQQDDEDHEDDGEHEGHEQPRVAARRAAQVGFLRGRAADENA
jgi:hypothetical protein